MGQTQKQKRETPQQDSPSIFPGQNIGYDDVSKMMNDMNEFYQARTQQYEVLVDKVFGLAIKLFDKEKSKDSNDENCEQKDVVKDDSSAQQQRFKQSYPKLRREAKF